MADGKRSESCAGSEAILADLPRAVCTKPIIAAHHSLSIINVKAFRNAWSIPYELNRMI